MADDDMGYSGGLAAALMGDEAFIAAIDAADPGSWGGTCECGCYFVGHRHAIDPAEAACPNCGSARFGMENPALGYGPTAVRRRG